VNVGINKEVDLQRIVRNLRELRARTGRFVYAVLKANAYGCGAMAVGRALAEVTDGYYVFDLAEAVGAGLGAYGKPVIVMDHPWRGYSAEDYFDARARPIVHSVERARELKGCDPVLAVDTAMRRFGCPAGDVDRALAEGGIREAMTHGVRLEEVRRLRELCGGRGLFLHAAATALMDDDEALMDAIRPGLALYRGALRVTARVVEARDLAAGSKAGYTQFDPSPNGDGSGGRIGVILAGYSHGYKPGLCMIRGEKRRVFEVGMQSAYVELRTGEGAGELITLLGDNLTEADVAAGWQTSSQEVLVRLGLPQASPEIG